MEVKNAGKIYDLLCCEIQTEIWVIRNVYMKTESQHDRKLATGKGTYAEVITAELHVFCTVHFGTIILC